mmetsp:Transcript_6073/g.8670  ORF Transcript_6073/g.8670 Transcript_6073/m.8670 type:complete len:217 (-) Transcript_6073:1305-1955(-)
MLHNSLHTLKNLCFLSFAVFPEILYVLASFFVSIDPLWSQISLRIASLVIIRSPFSSSCTPFAFVECTAAEAMASLSSFSPEVFPLPPFIFALFSSSDRSLPEDIFVSDKGPVFFVINGSTGGTPFGEMAFGTRPSVFSPLALAIMAFSPEVDAKPSKTSSSSNSESSSSSSSISAANPPMSAPSNISSAPTSTSSSSNNSLASKSSSLYSAPTSR